MLTQNGINYICQNFGDTDLCCVASGLSWYYTYQNIDYHETGATAQIVSRFTLGIIESLTMTNPARGTFTQAMLNAANGSPVTLQDAKEITYHDEPSEDQWCYTEGPPPPECSDFTDEASCIAIGCYWWSDGTCHDHPEEQPPPPCSGYTNQNACLAAGCYWWPDQTCHDTPYQPPPNCEDYTTQSSCLAAGCYWYNNSCHSLPPTPPPNCADYTNQYACITAGCYWYDNRCHSYPQEEEIDWLPYFAIGILGIVAVALILKQK